MEFLLKSRFSVKLPAKQLKKAVKQHIFPKNALILRNFPLFSTIFHYFVCVSLFFSLKFRNIGIFDLILDYLTPKKLKIKKVPA